MNSYVESVLGRGEEVIYEARLSLASFYFLVPICAILILFGLLLFFVGLFEKDASGMIGVGIAILVFGGLLLLRPLLAFWTTELAITNRRIIAKFGVINRSTIEVNMSKIESIRVNQSILGRIFNFGDLTVIGTGGTKEPIPRISKPVIFRQKFGDALATHDEKSA